MVRSLPKASNYTKNNVLKNFRSLDEFLNSWKDAEKKSAVVEELERQGVVFSALREEVGKEFDPFDLVCHVAFEQKPLTRREEPKM